LRGARGEQLMSTHSIKRGGRAQRKALQNTQASVVHSKEEQTQTMAHNGHQPQSDEASYLPTPVVSSSGDALGSSAMAASRSDLTALEARNGSHQEAHAEAREAARLESRRETAVAAPARERETLVAQTTQAPPVGQPGAPGNPFTALAARGQRLW